MNLLTKEGSYCKATWKKQMTLRMYNLIVDPLVLLSTRMGGQVT